MIEIRVEEEIEITIVEGTKNTCCNSYDSDYERRDRSYERDHKGSSSRRKRRSKEKDKAEKRQRKSEKM